MRVCTGLPWISLVENAMRTPKHKCWLKYSKDNPRHMRTVLFYLIQTTVCTGAPDHWARTPDIENCAYSIKYLNNIQNALPTDFKPLHIKAMVSSVLSKVSINFRI